jgi:hypothetical protein
VAFGGGQRRGQQRGVTGGVEHQRAARLVRHGRARTRFLPFPFSRTPQQRRGLFRGPTRQSSHASRERGCGCPRVTRAALLLGLVNGP